MPHQIGYCLFLDTEAKGPGPADHDENGLPCWHPTRRAAEQEIVENLRSRLAEFDAGERDFEDAITVEEYVVEVTVLPSGEVVAHDPE